MNIDTFGKYRNYLLPLMDCFAVILGYYLISVLITDSFLINPTSAVTRQEMLISIILGMVVLLIVFYLTKRYSRIIRYENNQDYFMYIILSVISLIIVSVIEELILHMKNPSIKLNLAVGVLVGILVVVFRLIIKYVLLSNMANATDDEEESPEKLLIIGGGYSANDIIKTLKTTLKGKYEIVGIIDDNDKRRGYSVSGVKIIGNRNDIIRICQEEKIDSIFFSIVNIDSANKKEILEICNKTKAKVKVLPSLTELITEDNLFHSLRNVEIEDLLGREPVELDNHNIKSLINEKVVLVTGGGGSIGSELCRQIMLHNPKILLMLDIYENSLYDIEQELKSKYPNNNNIKAIVANIRDKDRMFELFEEYSPEVVFHAAAHKHVPLMENNPTEAIKNNIFGTYNLVNASDKYHTKRFILISTDKAVNPTNIMGSTKRVCEMIIQAKDKESETEFVAVRFGNVLGSNGSVIPLFKKQIEAGGPVTVTHKEITRFFMTIPEAVSLVLQSITYAKGGEIFVLDMGEPVKIYDLATSLIELSGLTLGEDIDIEITGMRPGEKLYEELLMDEEDLQETEHKKIFITKPMDFTMDDIEEKLDQFRYIIDNDITDKSTIIETVKKCVPTYREPEEVNGE